LVIDINTLRRELADLLSEPLAMALERERTTFDRAIAPFGGRLVLSGAGNLGRKALAALRKDGVEPLAFVDNNSALWGTRIAGVSVYSPEEGSRLFGQSATFCVTIWRGEGTDTMAQRRRPLLDAGCLNVVDFGAMFWKYGESLLPHYSLDLPHRVLAAAGAVRAGFEQWNDDASRAEYVAQVRWRLRLDFDNLPPPVKEEIYFPSDLMKILDQEVFVDCGAYDGDTIRDFIRHSRGHFKSVYAFEADKRNFSKLEKFIKELPEELRTRITPLDVALSERSGIVHFAESGTAASAVSERGIPVKCVALDEVLTEAPTWIKMDIEGSEPAALRGAQRMISAHAPVLSICVYHSQHHLWSIPLQIAAMHPDYRMHLRPFVPESWDLVCYAIPATRYLQ
jgi:FkbM family methyltransferase